MIAAAFALGAGPARALAISDIHPLYFSGPGGFGFSSTAVGALGKQPEFSATPASSFLDAGGRAAGALPGPPLLIEQQRITAIHRNPQAAGRVPSVADPLVIDSQWTLRNDSGSVLPAGFLLFLLGDSRSPLQYPGLKIGLDGDLLSIVEYSAGGVGYLFGAVRLPSLGAGQSIDFPVRYVVGGRLDYDAARNSFVLPQLGLSGLLVPEPGTAAALGLGLAALGARRGARRASASARSS